MPIRIHIWLLIFVISTSSCKKYLDQKSDQRLVTASSLADLQAILDNSGAVHQQDPLSGERASDNYFISAQQWQQLVSSGSPDARAYIWGTDIYNPGFTNDWGYLYNNVQRANTVLSLVDGIPHGPTEETEYRQIKGSAYFVRGRSFLLGATLWAKAWDEVTGVNDLGIPLRLNPDFNIITTRASVKETYEQILRDLKVAAMLLPIYPAHPTRPSQPAAYGFIARTYLSMRQYDSAGYYANLCLQLKDDLLNLNPPINSSANFPITRFNPEVIYDAVSSVTTMMGQAIAKIDTTLYRSFASNDLRQTVYFRNNNNGSYAFKGSYSGSNTGFTGIAVDEVYLMRAEAAARQGKVIEALNDLNRLLEEKWRVGFYVPYTETDPEKVLQIILQERRKQLIYRGLRWMDIKRLNKEGQTIILQRVLDGEVYKLSPNESRYALPIPQDVIDITGIPQN
ncbi:MAG: RagB/SusD family nutrient uptake outer membrane protein [Sphingobacteriales bacterium]|nr:RagB/SusD family nutrient uptake outer membrane protein [Sphingobacteriales bacterium]OJW00131.1 MAG: hypothetical protein BGO52_03325 [Sphingobacteriales bacterium 44-61]